MNLFITPGKWCMSVWGRKSAAIAGMTVKMTDMMSLETYERPGNEMAEIGLFVVLQNTST